MSVFTDALLHSVAKAKSATHTNRGCLVRPFIFDSFRRPASRIHRVVCYGRSSDLSRLLRLPNIKSVAKSAINTQLHRDLQQQVLSRIRTGFP